MHRTLPVRPVSVATLVLTLWTAPARAQCELELQELAAPDGAAGDAFGYRLERRGSLAAIAATFDDDRGPDSGSVWVAELDPLRGWGLTAKLLASDGAAGDAFGYSVAVGRETILVGAPQHDENGPASGAVYAFERRGNAWTEVARFAPADARAGAGFGYAMALDGEQLLVGAPSHGLSTPGRAYLYGRDPSVPGGWSLEFDFTSEDPTTALEFGQDVALAGSVLAVSGARSSVVPYSDTYVVHVREHRGRGPRGWVESARLDSPTGTRDIFGWELSLEGGRLAVAAPAETDLATFQIGAVYLYGREASGWRLEDRLAFPTRPGESLFAPEEVDLRGDWIVTGSGDLFVFGRDVGGENAWGEVARLVVEEGSDGAFGLETSLEGDSLLVGAPGRYDLDDPGEVYVYDLARLARATWRNDAMRANPDVLRSLARPLLGTTWRAEVDLRPAGGAARLDLFARAIERPLRSGAVRLGAGRLASFTSPGPVARFALALPPTTALCGLRVTAQATRLGSAAPELSNAQDLVLGFE